MSPLQYQRLLNTSQLTQDNQGIVRLVVEILVLEARVNSLNDQSEYFLWGISSHAGRIAELVNQYNRIRGEFNQHTEAHFLNEIVAQEQKIVAYAEVSPLIARGIMTSRAHRIIQQMNEMISLKKIINHLPTIEKLKEAPEVIEALFKISY